MARSSTTSWSWRLAERQCCDIARLLSSASSLRAKLQSAAHSSRRDRHGWTQDSEGCSQDSSVHITDDKTLPDELLAKKAEVGKVTRVTADAATTAAGAHGAAGSEPATSTTSMSVGLVLTATSSSFTSVARPGHPNVVTPSSTDLCTTCTNGHKGC